MGFVAPFAMVVALVACGRLGFDPLVEEGAGNDPSQDNPPSSPMSANVMFVSATAFSTSQLGGLEGADARCQEAADAAGLPGIYVAWLSTATVDARTRLAGARGWVRPDGKPFADTVDDLSSGRVFYPPLVDEYGIEITGSDSFDFLIGTGTQPDGTSGGQDCAGWTANSGLMRGGVANSGTSRWTAGFTNLTTCASTRLYCFGVDRDIAVIPAQIGRRAFVSRDPWLPGGGLASADAACQSDAASAGLTGNFRALLPTATASAASRFAAGANYIRVDGIAIADSLAKLFAGETLSAFNVNALGAHEESSFVTVITGSSRPDALGDPQATCGGDWTTSGPNDLWSGGNAMSIGREFFGRTSTAKCDVGGRLYCLED